MTLFTLLINNKIYKTLKHYGNYNKSKIKLNDTSNLNLSTKLIARIVMVAIQVTLKERQVSTFRNTKITIKIKILQWVDIYQNRIINLILVIRKSYRVKEIGTKDKKTKETLYIQTHSDSINVKSDFRGLNDIYLPISKCIMNV